MVVRLSSWTTIPLALSVTALGCGCPRGNLVVAARNVGFDLQLMTAGTELTGHGLSPPGGEGISFDRATISAGEAGGPPAPGDLLLFSISPGCHPDATGASLCDRTVRVALTVHGVTSGGGSYTLDDAHAELRVAVDEVVAALRPCPGKPGLTGCAADAGAPAPYIAQTGIQGALTIEHLAENCWDVIAACALNAVGGFQVTAGSASGDTVTLAAGTVTAEDSFSYQDGTICNQ
jgi:hypothetical protein